MGFTFKGLTSSALVSNNNATNTANNVDVADVPASVEGHTRSFDVGRPDLDEKIGAPHAIPTNDSEEELQKVDTTAQRGTQNVQAMTHVWSRRDLIIAYIM